MTTVGRWSPNKVRKRLLEDSWAFPNSGMVLMRPSSIAFSGVTASITVNGSVSFSAVDSLSLNGVFTSAYDNYMIVARTSSSTGGEMYFRMRTSGTDSTTGYTWQYLYATGTSVSGLRGTSATVGYFSGLDSTLRDGNTLYLYGPNLTQPTAARCVAAYSGYAGSGAGVYDFVTTHSPSSSYDGVTISLSSGTITGLVSVYGLGG